MQESVCKTAFYPTRDNNNIKDTILIYFDILVAILNVTSNSLVVFVIFKTRQYWNPSIKLVLMLSIADIFTAVVSQPLFIYFLYDNSLECELSIFLQFVFFFFPYFSVYTIAIIVYDRYARIKYLNKYNSYMTKTKLMLAVFLAVCATTIQNGIVTVGTLQESHQISGFGVLPLNVATLVFEVVIYTKTIYKLRQYKKERRQKNFPAAENSFTRLAASYLLMIIIFFTPFMFINTLYVLYPKVSQSYLDMQYTWLVSMLVYCFNSFANAIIFLRVNRKAKVHIKLFIQRCLKTRFEHAHIRPSQKNMFFLNILHRDKRSSMESRNTISFDFETTSV